MTNITTSPIVEDRYIAHMAGLDAGQKTIGHTDKFNATYAQKRPISNTISAGIIGSVKGMAVTTLGLLASPFLNSTSRASIMGNSWEVCSSCGINVKATMDILHKAVEIFDPRQAMPFFDQQFDAIEKGLAAAGQCLTDSEALSNCRVINYAGSILDTVVNNYTVVGAAALGLTVLYTYSKMNQYAEEECKAEALLKHELTDRFKKIASRLSCYNPDQAAHECARRILLRRYEINEEVSKLGLPSLSWADIEAMTEPVFEAAIRLQRA